jgi:uncharacterized membrane protein YphA (DoxX/SURF4 family)
MVKVPSDPAHVIVNHASFRVQLAQGPRVSRKFAYSGTGGSSGNAFEDTGRVPAMGMPRARRRAVVWSGQSEDTGPMRVLQAAARGAGTGPGQQDEPSGAPGRDAGATQVLPHIGAHPLDNNAETQVIGPRSPESDAPLLGGVRQAGGTYDEHGPHQPYGLYGSYDAYDDEELTGPADEGRSDGERRGDGPVRHAYYPGRRMNLGVVLLPLRIFLGFVSVYAGMGKLCDPVYFDGGERGSMVNWLNSLHPWPLAEPLRDFALTHPVGSGLSVAFLQIVIGVLTMLGLWQRLSAAVGALLSAALIVTVSWKTVPVYDAPDIIFLAAWSPLIIAGAPVYSVDAHLAGDAWRTLGPRSELWELRRRVLRRGTVIAALVVGATLLVGGILGGAVRSAEVVTVPGPDDAPTNHLPGSPLPDEPGARRGSPSDSTSPSAPHPSASPSGATTAPGATQGTAGQPSQTQGTVGQAPSKQPAPTPPAGSGGSSGSTGGGDEPGLVGGILG